MSDEARKTIERWWGEYTTFGHGTVKDLDEALACTACVNPVVEYLDGALKDEVTHLLEMLTPEGFVDDCHPTPLEVFEHLTWLMHVQGAWLAPIFADFFGDTKWVNYTNMWDSPGDD